MLSPALIAGRSGPTPRTHREPGNTQFWALILPSLSFSRQLKSFGHHLSLFVKLWVLKVIHPKFFVELSKIEIHKEGNKFLSHYFKASCDLASTPLPSRTPAPGLG